MATSPSFPGAPRKEIAQISAANTNLDGTGTIVDAFTAGANGSVVNRVRFKATATITDGKIGVYIKISSTYYLVKEVLVNATTPAAHVIAAEPTVEDFGGKGIILASGYKLSFSTRNAEPFNVECEGADF